MPLVARLQAHPETISEMEKGADLRFLAGNFLIQNGFLDDGVYLLGYTAEILLKTAYCRVDPNVKSSYLVESRISLAKRYWRSVFGQTPSGHDLLFLALSIEDERPKQGKPLLSASTAALFAACVNRISENWTVEMRYHSPMVSSTEALDILSDVQWIRQNYKRLWS